MYTFEECVYKLKSNLFSYIHGTNDAMILSNIFICILILQYKYNTDTLLITDIITSIVSGIYLADLTTGLIHIYLDTVNTNSTPEIQKIIDSFKDHHINPKTFLDISNLDLLYQTSIMPIPLFMVLFNFVNKTNKSIILTQIVYTCSAIFGQITHKYAHYINHATIEQRELLFSRLLSFLQDNHIIISPLEHRKHHQSTLYDVNFCILNGWANPLLNRIVGNPIIHRLLFE